MRMRGSETDDRELGLFWSGINSIGQRVDRLIRRLETPGPDQRNRIEPHIKPNTASEAASDEASARRPETVDAAALLRALDDVAIDANIAALGALQQINRDSTDAAPSAIRAMSDQMAAVTEGYVALATDVLELDNPLDGPIDGPHHAPNHDRPPVWAGSLERRFMHIVEAAESLLPQSFRRAERR